MLQPCQDNYFNQFSSYADMMNYHETQTKESRWERSEVCSLRVAPLDKDSPLYDDASKFAPGISEDAIKDTADNLGLAVKLKGDYYPVRETAYKSLLDRAKISGSALPKLKRTDLAKVLNSCLGLHKAETLILIRDEKVSAVHSGDQNDYSILVIDQLLECVKAKLDERFAGNVFDDGYCDHSLASASWSLPGQKEDLLEAYKKTLEAQGQTAVANKLVPGIRFSTSDTGVASAKVSALLMGLQYPIHIGGMISVEHRRQSKVADFNDGLDMLFAQFGDTIKNLEKLTTITLDYPVNAMTRVCKKLSLPKKAALEAISMYEMAYGGGSATAHDVFMALQEIPFMLKNQVPESKLLSIQENMARALMLRWSDYDLAKAVEY